MARRSIWNGAISFGMVVIPVKLYPATENKDFSFVNLHSTCNTRIKQPRFCPYHEVMVESSEIVKAYEYAKELYVVMEDSDFDDLPVSSKRTIEITRFVDLASVDPIFFERSYSLEPQDMGVKPYYLLKQALETTQRVAVAKVSLRQKENLCLLRPFEDGIMLETMNYADEIRGMNELNLPADTVSFSEPEISMAVALIDQLTGPFEPDLVTDDYRAALEAVIEVKMSGGQPAAPAPVAAQGKVGDLMEALKASIEATKTERANGSKPKAETKPKAESPAAKKAPEKAKPKAKAKAKV